MESEGNETKTELDYINPLFMLMADRGRESTLLAIGTLFGAMAGATVAGMMKNGVRVVFLACSIGSIIMTIYSWKKYTYLVRLSRKMKTKKL
jgi:hypothetical protein